MKNEVLFERIWQIVSALPEGTGEAGVLRLIFESERKKNVLLDRIIKGETSCEKETSPLVSRANLLKLNEVVISNPGPDLSKIFGPELLDISFNPTDLKHLVPAVLLSVATMMTLGILSVFALILLFDLIFIQDLGLVTAICVFLTLVILFRYLEYGDVIDGIKGRITRALEKARWLDRKILLAYGREQR